MQQRIARIGTTLLIVCGLLVSAALASGGATAEQTRLAGPWYSPHELEALIAYSNASFAEKQAILAGTARQPAARTPVELVDGGNLHESIGQADAGKDAGNPNLQRGATYQASSFPIPIRLGVPDDTWAGGQFQSGRFRFVQLHHWRPDGKPPMHGWGFVTIETGTGPTASVETIVQRLHATPNIEAGPITAARVAGFPGKRFDATIVGTDRPRPKGISLAPFTPNHHCGFCSRTMRGETQDHKWAKQGQLFRIFVIDVRGKTVVVYAESSFFDQPLFPPAKTFPTFLPYARQLLSTLTFPR